MKSRLLVAVAAGFIATSVLAAPEADRNLNPMGSAAAVDNTPVNIDDVSYSFGFMMGSNMKRQKMDLKTDQFISGMQDALAGKDGKFDRQEMMKMLMSYQRQVREKMMAEQKKAAEENKQEGEKFLESNKSKPGVVALPSGLQYKVIEQGNGAKPTDADKVKVTYKGTLINGEEFGGSEDESKPVEFSLQQVIPGWKEALPMMQQGATWELYVPANLAYGARGTRGKIGPNETLIFRIKLVDIVKDAAKATNTSKQNQMQSSKRHQNKTHRTS